MSSWCKYSNQKLKKINKDLNYAIIIIYKIDYTLENFKKQVDGENSTSHLCVCLIGWQGPDCSKCRPYWQCPNQDPDSIDSDGNPRVAACVEPNQCFCDDETEENDETGYCNLADLNNRNITDVL